MQARRASNKPIRGEIKKAPDLLEQNLVMNLVSLALHIMSLTPPFTEEGARAKVKKAQDLWNTKNPENVAKAYTDDTVWRNRDKFLQGTEAVKQFLTWKWEKEHNYRLRKELFAFSDGKIAVQFWHVYGRTELWFVLTCVTRYEYQDSHDGMKWKRCYGLEDWTFADDGRMRKRQMSGNDVEIGPDGRWFVDSVDVNDVAISEEHW